MEHSANNSRTWSRHVQNLAVMYDLETFLPNLSDSPPKHNIYKANILTKITKYWESKLRKDAQNNSKMKFLNVNLIGLSGRCHPALSNITTTKQVSRMRPHIKMLCGDYYTYELKSKYQGGSPHCRLCGTEEKSIENIQHILTTCLSYSDVRNRIISDMKNILKNIDYIQCYETIFEDNLNLTQFILDCTSANLPIRLNYSDKITSDIFELSRGLCYSINKTRLYLLKDLENK